VVALRIAAVVARHRGAHATEPELAVQPAHRGRPAVDLLDVVHLETPAIADNLAPVSHLAARFGIEGRFAKQDRDAVARETLHGRDLGVDLDALVADERHVGRVHLGGPLPLCQVGELVDAHLETPGAPVLLGPRPLGREGALEALDVDGVTALARHQLREIDREAVRVVQAERVVAADRAADLGPALRRVHRRDLVEARHPALDRREKALLLDARRLDQMSCALAELGVCVAHGLDDRLDERREGRLAPAQ
jgi:hypothetical protein